MSHCWPQNGRLRDDARINAVPSCYTTSQIFQWLSDIGYHTSFSVESGAFPTTLDNLHALTRLQLVKYPYENTTMHLGSQSSDMDIDPDALFQRIVGEGKGSYCFGMNTFFMEALRGLGYRVYSGAGRVRHTLQPPSMHSEYTPIVHMVLFVQPADGLSTYLVDVGFGGTGLSGPILLSSDPKNVVMGVSPTESHRLTRGARSDSCLVEPTSSVFGKDWRLEVRHTGKGTAESEWHILYTFTEDEYFTKDYEAANFVVSKMPEGIFHEGVVFSKCFWLSEQETRVAGDTEDHGRREAASVNDKGGDSLATTGAGTERYMGRISVKDGVFRRHVGAKSAVLTTVKTKEELRAALLEYCGFDVTLEGEMKGNGSGLAG